MLGLSSQRHMWLFQAVLVLGVAVVLGAVTVRLPGILAVLPVLAVLGAVAVAYRPELGLLAIVVITTGLVDFERLPLLQLGPASLHITDLLLLYLLLLIVLRALALPGFKLVGTPLDTPVALLCGAILLAALLAILRFDVDPQWVFRRLRPLTYYLGFFAVTNLIRNRKQLNFLVQGLFAIAVVASLAMALQAAFPSLQLVKSQSQELVTATVEYQGVLRTFLQADRLIYLMIPVSLASLVVGGKWLPAPFEAGRLAILATGLLLSFQRNYWASALAMAGLLLLVVSWPARLRMLRWLSVAALALMLLTAVPGLPIGGYLTAARDRLFIGSQLGTLENDPSLAMRTMEYRYAIPSIAHNPILGVGLGNEYRPFTVHDVGRPAPGLRWYMHNSYLWILIMSGVVGFTPFVWLYGAFVVRGWKRWRGAATPQYRVLVLGSTLGVLGQAISNLVAPNFLQSWTLIVFTILMGLSELIYLWDRVDDRATA